MASKKILENQRIRRALNNNAYTKKYEKTQNGFLMRMYRNMKSRVTGVQKKNPYLYVGKELIDKKDFYELAVSSNDFQALFKIWSDSGYVRKMCPSVDRINPELGYTKENIRFVTWEFNYRNVRKGMNFKKEWLNSCKVY